MAISYQNEDFLGVNRFLDAIASRETGMCVGWLVGDAF